MFPDESIRQAETNKIRNNLQMVTFINPYLMCRLKYLLSKLGFLTFAKIVKKISKKESAKKQNRNQYKIPLIEVW